MTKYLEKERAGANKSRHEDQPRDFRQREMFGLGFLFLLLPPHPCRRMRGTRAHEPIKGTGRRRGPEKAHGPRPSRAGSRESVVGIIKTRTPRTEVFFALVVHAMLSVWSPRVSATT